MKILCRVIPVVPVLASLLMYGCGSDEPGKSTKQEESVDMDKELAALRLKNDELDKEIEAKTARMKKLRNDLSEKLRLAWREAKMGEGGLNSLDRELRDAKQNKEDLRDSVYRLKRKLASLDREEEKQRKKLARLENPPQSPQALSALPPGHNTVVRSPWENQLRLKEHELDRRIRSRTIKIEREKKEILKLTGKLSE